MNMNQKGVSVTELLLAVFILGGIVVAGGHLIKINSESISKIEAQQNLLTLVNEMRTRTMTQKSCIDSIGTGQEFQVNRAIQSFDVEGKHGSPIKFDLSGGEIVTEKNEVHGLNLYTDFLRLTEAENIGRDTLGNKIYKVTLSGGFSVVQLDGNRHLRSLKINSFFIKVDKSNKINNCFNTNPGDPESIAYFSEMVCKSLGGIYRKNSFKCGGLNRWLSKVETGR